MALEDLHNQAKWRALMVKAKLMLWPPMRSCCYAVRHVSLHSTHECYIILVGVRACDNHMDIHNLTQMTMSRLGVEIEMKERS